MRLLFSCALLLALTSSCSEDSPSKTDEIAEQMCDCLQSYNEGSTWEPGSTKALSAHIKLALPGCWDAHGEALRTALDNAEDRQAFLLELSKSLVKTPCMTDFLQGVDPEQEAFLEFTLLQIITPWLQD